MSQEELNMDESTTSNTEDTQNTAQDNGQSDNKSEQNDIDNQQSESSNNDAQAQISELNDKYIRLVAEFDNFRKRNAKEKIELIKTASEDIIKSLLEVMDDMDRAENQFQTSTQIDDLKNGISLIFNKFRNTLIAKGLEPMNAKEQEFNPDLHEAITEIPAPQPELVGKVVDEVIKGYTLNEKIIRHAKVVVGK